MWDLKPNRRRKSWRDWLSLRRRRPPRVGAAPRLPHPATRHERGRRSTPALRAGGPPRWASLAARLRGLRLPPVRMLYALAVLWIGLGLLVGGWAMWHAPLREVEVRGNRLLSGQQLAERAGLVAGLPMGTIDPYVLAARMASHPLVRSVDVRRIFPNQVRITVTEREPVARIVFDNGTQGLIDAERVVLDLPSAAPVDREALPLIVGAGALQPPGARLGDTGLLEGLHLLSELYARGLGPVSQVRMDVSSPFQLLLRVPRHAGVLVLPKENPAFALDHYMALSNIDGLALNAARRVDLRLAGEPGRQRVIVAK
ncbi:MAG: FtsQ-type POTRA domain-containing protein [Candidatus Lambdaproteobacteria bacterium]|nr:FtsQ-type POTRA domain-containing protein [Candidatus Lambdaproteobacteria bacterium]